MHYERNSRGAQFQNTDSGLLGSESLYTLCSMSWSAIQYVPKSAVLKLAHLECACAFVDGA
jgi:hypothetical protein